MTGHEAAMARIRTIKPEFWTDETLARCCMPARLLFIATWNFADDFGDLDRSAYQLKAQVFPYDNVDCEPLIQELLQPGLLIEYQAFGKKYLHIKGFRKHQRNEKPAAPRFPVYDADTVANNGPTVTSDGSTDTSVGKTGTSNGSYLLIKEGMIKEGATDGRPPAVAGARMHGRGKPRGHLTLLPEDFALTDTMREQALRRCPDCDVDRWFELFRAHHMAHGKAMKSWCAAWVTWVGNGERYGYPRRAGSPAGAGLPLLNN
jgi:hypothetical protein